MKCCELHEGNCLDVMTTFLNDSIDMILCDLPYGITACKWDVVIPFEPLWKQYRRIIKSNGAIVLTASQPFTSALISSNYRMFKYSTVWEKSKATGFLNAKRRPLVAHEDICIFSKGTPRYYPQMTQGTAYNKGVRKQQTDNDVYGRFKQTEVKSSGARYPRSVIYFGTAETEGKVWHKTQKPVALFKYLIQTYTKEGDIVLDNCAGSGTTGVSARALNRNSILIENDPTCYKKIRERMGFDEQVRR